MKESPPLNAADRKYLWLTVWLFALLGLVGLGAMLYQPLSLAYAIYRVEHSSPPVADKWLLVCLDAARGGNRRAIEVIIDHAGVSTPTPLRQLVRQMETGRREPDVAYLAAEAQPERFFEALGRRDKREALKVLEAVEDSSYCDAGSRYSKQWLSPTVGLAQSLEYQSKSTDPKVRKVAVAALEFTRRRFAKELAETEKANPPNR